MVTKMNTEVTVLFDSPEELEAYTNASPILRRIVLNQAERATLLQEKVDEYKELCKDMLPVFEAARPLVLTLERLKDGAKG